MSEATKRLAQVGAHLHPKTDPGPAKPPHPVHYHTLSPTHFLPRAASIEPEATAIYHITATGQTLRRSYQQLADRARGLAYYLRRHGCRRVGIVCPNTPAFLESIFGIAAAGAINVAVNYRLKPDDIEYILDHAEVDTIIIDAEFIPLIEEYSEKHPHIRVIVDTDTDITKDEPAGPFDEAIRAGLQYDLERGGRGWEGLTVQFEDENSTIALAYTSGTTARPKGVVYTHRGAYLAALANVIESGLNRSTEPCRYLWTLPMFHAMGWTFPWAVTAVRGTHYCLRKIDYPQIWGLFKTEAITHYCAAPTVNTLLCNSKEAEPLPRPIRVIVAASPPTPSLFQQMLNFNLHPVHVYGLTETYGPITRGYYLPSWDDLPPDQRFQKMARQGHGFLTSLPVRVIKREIEIPEKKLPGDTTTTTTNIIDVARNGKEIGEIVFTGNICAAGYFKDEVATRKLFEGGVLHSGDLAVWHPDGAIQILDRAKDIIISGGENISSVALESILVTHPDILEAGVVAVHDDRWGERPKAFITLKNKGRKVINGQEVVEWTRNHRGISRFMVPREVEIVEELPKTSTGKVKKGVLREWASSGGLKGEVK
ncbi:MAG: Acyl-CoA synthetase member 3, mitochondrial [Watsoniomyces obsoletus]|nr:MAG: Acyl-CoA synthetase member 3, mitochondrial [Watsoniomyces obsoletus]